MHGVNRVTRFGIEPVYRRPRPPRSPPLHGRDRLVLPGAACHSDRRQIAGSVPAALHAGPSVAAAAASIEVAPAATKTQSPGAVSPGICAAAIRPSHAPPISPNVVPAAAISMPRPKNQANVAPRRAPSASLTPISARRDRTARADTLKMPTTPRASASNAANDRSSARSREGAAASATRETTLRISKATGAGFSRRRADSTAGSTAPASCRGRTTTVA